MKLKVIMIKIENKPKIKIHPSIILATNQLIHNYYLNFKN